MRMCVSVVSAHSNRIRQFLHVCVGLPFSLPLSCLTSSRRKLVHSRLCHLSSFNTIHLMHMFLPSYINGMYTFTDYPPHYDFMVTNSFCAGLFLLFPCNCSCDQFSGNSVHVWISFNGVMLDGVVLSCHDIFACIGLFNANQRLDDMYHRPLPWHCSKWILSWKSICQKWLKLKKLRIIKRIKLSDMRRERKRERESSEKTRTTSEHCARKPIHQNVQVWLMFWAGHLECT